MADHAENVLSGIVSDIHPRRDLLAMALVQLQPEHFYSEIHRNIFSLLRSYYDRTGEVMPLHVFAKALEDSQVETAKALAYTQAFSTLASRSVPEDEFKWSVGELREEQTKRMTGTAIAEAMEILERGYQVGKEFLKGHQDARKFMTTKVHEIERLGSDDTAPEGDILQEPESILQEYVARRDMPIGSGVMSGINYLDDTTGGFQRGEMILACAYAGQGKSQLATTIAWSTAIEQGKNVFFATSETIRSQVIRRLLARHSRLPMFEREGGLNSSDIKRGMLSPPDEQVLAAVLDDWKNNDTYGKLNVLQVPRGATLSYVEMRLREWGRERPVDLVIVDYLALLKSAVRRNSEREEFNEILRDAKMMAVTFNDGQGVPLLSPWQMNREKFTEAMRNRRWGLASLSDTSEAEKSADTIIAMLRDEDNNREMRLQFLKVRDDEIPPVVDVEIDFRSSYIGDRQTTTNLLGGANFEGQGSFAPVGNDTAELMAYIQ